MPGTQTRLQIPMPVATERDLGDEQVDRLDNVTIVRRDRRRQARPSVLTRLTAGVSGHQAPAAQKRP
jgi:hypothetical protein